MSKKIPDLPPLLEVDTSLTDEQRMVLEAATFRRLVSHLQSRTDVQNIDLMNLADFCRNCLSKWYAAEADAQGISVEYEQVREAVYGMPYADWKAKYQTPASAEQLAAFAQKADAN